MKDYVISQQSRIEEIINNATLFKEHYSELTQNIIASMNKQIKSYVKNSRKSIMVDVCKLVIDGIDWNELQNRLAELLKSKHDNINVGKWIKLPKPSVSIEGFDDDVLTNMMLNCDVEHVKDFAKCRKIAKSQLAELLNDIDNFETELCDYRADMVKRCQSNVTVLFNYHFNYANDMYHKRNPSQTVVIDGKEIKLKRSQKEFITTALKELLC